MSEQRKYQLMQEHGASPKRLLARARDDGLTDVECIRLIRQLFGLSLIEAKAILVEVESGSTLEEHQESLHAGLIDAVAEAENSEGDE